MPCGESLSKNCLFNEDLIDMAVLYVGNLPPECTEELLYQKFSPVGNLLNIRMCKDYKTGQCLGYGFVHYASKMDANAAIVMLNYTLLKGRRIRLMWEDKNIKKMPLSANVFIKNLNFQLDEMDLHDIFANFGKILSLKLAINEDGSSKGHAFIQYEDEYSADEAIKQVNGKLIYGKEVCVTKFMPKDKRKSINLLQFHNVYIKNFDSSIKDEDLFEMCETFGDIISAKVMTDEKGISKCFGFVYFKSSESAKEAIKELNGKVLNGRILFAGRAKKKTERQRELIENFKRRIQEGIV